MWDAFRSLTGTLNFPTSFQDVQKWQKSKIANALTGVLLYSPYRAHEGAQIGRAEMFPHPNGW